MTDTRRDYRQESSMTYWWPRLEALDVPTPETVRVNVHSQEVEDSSEVDGGFIVKRPNTRAVIDAVRDVDGPPAFLRSDQMSAKHRMAKASKVSSLDSEHVDEHVWEVVERNEVAMGVPKTEAFYVREWLDLWHEYTAFTGTPIAAELRYFVHDGDVHGWAFYWSKLAIKRPNVDDWEERHERTKAKALSNPLQRCSEMYARDVAEEFDDGYWSVDFALTEDEQWYCIDMARGEASWHPESVEPPEGVETL